MEASKKTSNSEKPKGNCAHLNAATESGKDTEVCKECNVRKPKENCIPRANVETPSTSGSRKAASKMQRRKENAAKRGELQALYCNFFRENKELMFFLDHNMVSLMNCDVSLNAMRFSCGACNMQTWTLKKVVEHVRSEKHAFQLEVYWLIKQRVTSLPSPAVLRRLDEFLIEITQSQTLSRKSASKRINLEKEINDIFSTVPDCKVVMCGSSYHSAALKDSDLNLRVVVDEKDRNPTVFKSLISRISSSLPGKIRVKKHLYLKDYYCLFTYKNTQCEVKFFDKTHLLNTIFVEKCAKFDVRIKQLLVLFRYWAKLCRITNKSGECWNTLALDLMVIHFLQHLEEPIIPIFSNISSCEREVDLKAELYLCFNEWKTENTDSLALLWCQLLKFYATDSGKKKPIFGVTEELSQKAKNSSGKRIIVENPFALGSNVLSSPSLDSYVRYCLKKTLLHFCTPQTSAGPVFDFIRQDVRRNTLNVDGYVDFVADQMTMTRILVRALLSSLDAFDSLLVADDVTTLMQIKKKWANNYVNLCNLDIKSLDSGVKCASLRKSPREKVVLFAQEAELVIQKFKPEHSVFSFTEAYLNGGIKVPVNCQFCGKEVHPGECPVMKPPDFPLTTMVSWDSVQEVDSLCLNNLLKRLIDSRDEFNRNSVIREIERQIQLAFPNAKLTPFGSSCNGFGFKNSDLDLCLTFTDDSYNNDFKTEDFLKGLHRVLKKCRFLSNVTCISKATVPIVKFVHLPTRLEGDISIYNTIALVNTSLLRLYVQLDWRVQVLGLMVKHFASLKNILGASKGFLSSYAYTLMVIHFLQNCNPPIIPVLQELTANPISPVPVKMHEEHNIYFLDNIGVVRKIWPYFGLNKKSPGNLWFDFLYYYSAIFDSDNNVVSVRTGNSVTKQDKHWYVRSLCVEDPFKININLGRGLSMKRHNEVIRCFREELRRHLIQNSPQPAAASSEPQE